MGADVGLVTRDGPGRVRVDVGADFAASVARIAAQRELFKLRLDPLANRRNGASGSAHSEPERVKPPPGPAYSHSPAY